jgi:hypothetical protein
MLGSDILPLGRGEVSHDVKQQVVRIRVPIAVRFILDLGMKRVSRNAEPGSQKWRRSSIGGYSARPIPLPPQSLTEAEDLPLFHQSLLHQFNTGRSDPNTNMKARRASASSNTFS